MKKIIALVLSVVTVLLCMAALPAYAQESSDGAHNFLVMLGIVPDTAYNSEAVMTRGEFCDIIIKAMAQSSEGEYENPFTDVTDEHPFKNSVLMAANLGLVSGNGRNRFEPDMPISYAAAVKIAVEALGYSDKAYYLGGFPTGHLVIAGEINLIKGVPKGSDGNLNYGAAETLIYNFLNSDICTIKGVTPSHSVWETEPGKNPLTEYFRLSSAKGIIKAAGFATAIPGDRNDYKRITVDGKTFKTNLENTENFLGRAAAVWYDEDEYVKAIYSESVNSSVILNADTLDGFSDYILRTFNKDTGAEDRYNISKSYTFVKNGRNHIPDNSDFVFPEGNIELVDNDGDGIYDVVIANKYTYMVISAINTIDGIVYDNKNGGKSAVFKNEDGYYSYIESVEKDGSKSVTDIKNLQTDMVIMMLESDDGKYIKASVSKQILSGVVSEIDADGVLIDGVTYGFNSYFFEKPYISAGKSYNFLLAPDKTITALAQNQNSAMNYGYLYQFYESGSALSADVQISIMTESGEYIHPYFADYILLDGKRVTKTDSEIKAKLTNGDLPEYQLIKYELDAEKRVTKIDTCIDAPALGSLSGDSALFDKYSQNFDNDNSLTRFMAPTLSYWYQTFYTFTGHAVAGSATVMMVVPDKVLSGVTEALDEDDFTVTDGTRLVTASYTIETYDVGKDMQPGVIILYTTDSGEGGIAKESGTAIVDRVSEGVNEDKEDVHFIYLWQRGTFYKYPIRPDVYDEIKSSGNVPASGDIIRFSENKSGEIDALIIDAKYDASKGAPKLTSSAPADGQHGVNCYIGTVFSHTTSGITLLVDNDGISGVNASYSAAIVDGITPFMLRGTEKIAIYDTKTGAVRQGKLDMISDALSVGRDNASKVFIKSEKHNSKEIYIYQ